MIITLAELKSYLGVTDTSQDDVLNIFLDSANDFVEAYVGRNIEADDYTEYKDWDGQRYILLENYPVNTITSFQVNQWTLDTPDYQDVDASEYKLSPKLWKIFLTFYKERGFQNYKIEYNAGYTTIPGDLKLATLKLAGSYYNGKNSDGVQRETVAGDSITFESQQVSNDVLAILNNYSDV